MISKVGDKKNHIYIILDSNQLKQILFVRSIEADIPIKKNFIGNWTFKLIGIYQDQEYSRICNRIEYFLMKWLIQGIIFMD